MTLKKLAELAHVSPSTASKALANSREVSEETVRHVRRVARESGYLRQCKERRLSYRKPSAPTIAVVCPEIISVYYSAIATCLSRLAESHGGTSAVYLSGFEPERQSALLEDLAVKPGVDAAVLIPGAAGALIWEDFCIPVVQLGGTSYSPAFDCIDFDLEAGLLEAVRHLQGLGHRRIGYLGERLASPKEARVRAAMARAGLTAREEDFFIAAGRFEQAGYAAAKEALGRGDRPTAFIAAYDEVAFGAIRAFAESGLRVPEDLSIIGINDVPTASFAPAALTTIHAYVEEACGQAVDILLRKTADPDYRMVQRILVQCRLIPRETTGPARTL